MSSTTSDLRTTLLRRSAHIKQAAHELERLRAQNAMDPKSVRVLRRSQFQIENLHRKTAASIALSGDEDLQEWKELEMSMNLMRGTLQGVFKDLDALRDEKKRCHREGTRGMKVTESPSVCAIVGLLYVNDGRSARIVALSVGELAS
ncbi:hypothetical protein N0V90_003583 [Kalmusia sp. IMI 367209]|nr:hypothetical protein N0V90_003583 [Kalmusia sp. IMI 367209]